MPRKLLHPPSIYALMLSALQKLDVDRHLKDPSIPSWNQLSLDGLENAIKDDERQTLTLIFADGVKEEMEYHEFLPDYAAYNWPEKPVQVIPAWM